ncbi:response regulator [Lewinellaceae bacterium SD302]|nr:response regulator [Lewinellaceae bacterium SD302]
MTNSNKQRLPRLDTVLLVDDDAATNFLHRRVLKKLDCANRVIEVCDGTDALTYLTTKDQSGRYPQPQMILLDINMPAMNGWEFLQAYEQLPVSQRAGIVIVMVTTSTNPDDNRRARSFPIVNDFLSKPLTTEALSEIIGKHFQAA